MNLRARVASFVALLVSGASVLVAATGGMAAEDVGMPRLDPLWVTIASASLAIGAGRLLLDWAGNAASIVVGCAAVALASAGQLRTNGRYLGFVLVFVCAALLALRVGNAADTTTRPRIVSDVPRTLLMLAIAGFIALAWGLALPPAYRLGVRLMMHSFDRYEASTGLTDRIDLDSLDGMIQSDRVVLRVYGPAPDALRGIVYDRYESGRWRTSRANELRVVRVPARPSRVDDVVTVRRVGGPTDRWFMPLGSTAIATPAGRLHFDPYGIPRIASGENADVFWFRARSDAVDPAPPGDDDLAMPAGLRERLRALVTGWSADRGNAAGTMAALVQHLYGGYRYALRSHRRAGRDPVEDFLFEHREGHCEFFASALALLGRAAGIPTRVVTGYRVAERSPLGGYYIVREQNAHAWVEAYIPGAGWRTFDATPGAEVPQNRYHSASWGAALSDWIAAAASSAADFVAARSAWELAAGAGALALVYALLRVSRARREARKAARERGEKTSEAMAGFARLDAALTRAGVERRVGETLERYALRVAEATALGGVAPVVARAIEEYAAFRYGGARDEEAGITETLAAARAAMIGLGLQLRPH